MLDVAMFGGSRNQRGFFMCLTPVVRNYCFFGFSPIFCVATPRNAAGHGKGRGGLPLLSPLRVFLRPLLIAMLLGSPLYFAAQKHPVYGTRQGRRVTSIISTEGLFKTSPRCHAPQLFPIFCCAKTPRIRGTAGEELESY